MLELFLANRKASLKKEYKFHPKRKWRADFAIPEWKLLIEVEGGGQNGRHMRIDGFLKDMEKYNSATILGWQLFRITGAEFKKTQAVNLLQMWYDDCK
jgi:very-short-patch-repair endonuclease